MPLELDTRQRAMLRAMGVHVWLPGTAFAPQAAHSVVPVDVPQAKAQPTTVVAVPTTPVAMARKNPVQARPSAEPTSIAQPTVSDLTLGALDAPALLARAAACQACTLCAGRKNSTLRFSETLRQADWFVLGDPPDEDEDRAGQPFAQAPGLLLDNMLKAVGASRTSHGATGAHVSNVVKCRPPHGRIPQPAELAQCAAYLQREIALVQPKVIVAMGRFATQVLLNEYPELATLPLGKLRGSVYRYQGIPVVVTYHPKALLRTSADKAKAWADLCLAMDVLQAPTVDNP